MRTGTARARAARRARPRARAGRCEPSSRTACAKPSARAGWTPARGCPPPGRSPGTSALAPDGRRRLLAAAGGGLSRRARRRRHLRRGGGRRGAARRAGGAAAAARSRSTSSPATPTSRRSRAGLGARAARDAARRARPARSAIPTRAARRSSAPRSPVTCAGFAASWRTRARSSSAPARAGLRAAGTGARGGGIVVEDPGLPRAPRDPRGGGRGAPGAAGRRAWGPRGGAAGLAAAPTAGVGRDGHARPPVADRRSCSRSARRAGSSPGRGRMALIIEDDYDAEYRYDRAPLGALQGLAPDRVVYMGSVRRRSAPRCGLAGSFAGSLIERSRGRRRSPISAARRSTSSRLPGCSRPAPYDRHLRRRGGATARGATRSSRRSPGSCPRARVRGSPRGWMRSCGSAARSTRRASMEAAGARCRVYPLGLPLMAPRVVTTRS